MSKFDERRKQLGIQTATPPTSNSSGKPTMSAFDRRREEMAKQKEDTRQASISRAEERAKPVVDRRPLAPSSPPVTRPTTTALPTTLEQIRDNRKASEPRSALPTFEEILEKPEQGTAFDRRRKELVAQRQKDAENSPITKALTASRDFLTDALSPVTNLLPKPKSDTVGMRAAEKLGEHRSNVQNAIANTGVGAFVQGAGDAATLGLTSYGERLMGNPEVADRMTQSAPGRAGQIAGQIVLPAGKFKAGASILSNVGRGIAGGAVLGTGIEAGEALTGRNNQSLLERAGDVGMSAAYGGGGAGALGLVGKALGVAARKAGTKATQEVVSNANVTPRVSQPPALPSNVRRVEAPKDPWFNRLFGEQSVGITPASKSGKELIDTHIVTRPKEQGSLLSRGREVAENIEQDYIDKFAPFKKIDNATYDAAMDSTRANNLATTSVKDKFVDLEGNVIGNSLKDVYSTVPRGQKHIADRYVIARDAINRMDRGKAVYGKQKWFPQTAQEASDLVAKMEQQYPWLKQFGSEWNQFNRNRQDLWVQSGIIPQGTVDILRQTNPNYAPMFRQIPKGSLGSKIGLRSSKGGFSNQKAPVKKATGSTLKIVDPAQGMIETTASSYQAMMRNRAMQNIYESVSQNPERYKGVIEILDDTAEARQASMKAINEALAENGPEGVAELLNNELSLIFNKAKNATKPTDAVVTALVNGNPVKMKVSDPSLLKAIEDITPQQLEGILKLANGLSMATKHAATGLLAPLQGVRLALRDLPVAAAQSQNKKAFLYDLSHAMISQISDWLPSFIPGTERMSRLARSYYRAGGGYEAFLKGDSRVRAAASDITKHPYLSGQNVWNVIKKYNPFTALKGFGDAMENIPRIAAYSAQMRKQGWSRSPEAVRKAVDAGREATVNWSRRGRRGSQIESFFPYANAAIQGTYRVAKRFKEQPISATALIASTAAAKIWAYERYKDDPDYQYRRQSEKSIPVGKTADGKFITVPVEPTEAYIADQILNFYKWAKDNEEMPDAKENIQEGLDAFLPSYASGALSTFTGENKAIDVPRGVQKTFASSIAEPMVAAGYGKNYFGNDIIPREYQDEPTYQQYDETTSAAGKWAAENLGIDAFTFDYLGKKFGGDIAKVGLPTSSDVGKGDISGNIMEQVNARLRLLEDPVMQNDISNDYYKLSDIVKEAKKVSDKTKQELPAWYQKAYDEVTSTKKGSMSTAISNFNTMKKEAQRDTTLTAKERSELLRDIQIEINLLRIKAIERLEELGVSRDFR